MVFYSLVLKIRWIVRVDFVVSHKYVVSHTLQNTTSCRTRLAAADERKQDKLDILLQKTLWDDIIVIRNRQPIDCIDNFCVCLHRQHRLILPHILYQIWISIGILNALKSLVLLASIWIWFTRLHLLHSNSIRDIRSDTNWYSLVPTDWYSWQSITPCHPERTRDGHPRPNTASGHFFITILQIAIVWVSQSPQSQSQSQSHAAQYLLHGSS